MDSVAGTYCGVLPPNVETTLTLNADGTYLLIQSYNEKQNEREKLRGTFQVLDNNVLMLVHPSSGDNIFYKVRDVNHIVLIDLFGNDPPKEDKKNYILPQFGITECLIHYKCSVNTLLPMPLGVGNNRRLKEVVLPLE